MAFEVITTNINMFDHLPREELETNRVTRNRKSHSCTECRRRKKHCDRQVPGCQQCILRGTVDKCKWGDERDEDVLQHRTQKDPQNAIEAVPIDTPRQTINNKRIPSQNVRRSYDHSGQAYPHSAIRQDDWHSSHSSPSYTAQEAQEAFRRATYRYQNDERAALIAELAEADGNLGNQERVLTPNVENLRPRPTESHSYSPAWGDNPIPALETHDHQSSAVGSPSSSHSLSVGAMVPPLPSLNGSVTYSSRSSRTTVDSGPSHKTKVTADQALELLHHYHDLLPDKMICVDEENVSKILENMIARGDQNLDGLRQEYADIYGLLMMICASTMCFLPPTYCITMGIVTRYEQIESCIDDMLAFAEAALDSMPVPTLATIQAGTLYLHNLTPRSSAREHVERMDFYLRSARRLGLDRLGSPEDDERIWQEMDARSDQDYRLTNSPAILWAAQTLQSRNRRERNLGRIHWRFLVAKDWVASRLSGCYTVHQHSFTTSLPMLYSQPSDDYLTKDMTQAWQYVWIGAEMSRRYADLTAEAECLGKRIDYEKILEMDAELKEALDKRPKDLSPECMNMSQFTKAQQHNALLVSCTIWHRLFVIHRPFLMLSQLEPERYGLSASRSWEYARLTIQSVREASRTSSASVKQLPLHFRMLQASLVIISHLFLWPQSPSLSEMVEIHEELHFAIQSLQSIEGCNAKTIFAGQSKRLEALLAAASRIKRSRTGKGSEKCHSMAPWSRMSKKDGPVREGNKTGSIMSEVPGICTRADTPSSHLAHTNSEQSVVTPSFLIDDSAASANKQNPLHFGVMDTLDDQLLRLMGDRSSTFPTATDDLWTEIFTLLDTNKIL